MGDPRILACIRFFGRLHRQSRLRIHERIGRGSERLFGHGIRIVPDDVRSADRGHHPGGLCGAREVRCHRMVPAVLGTPGVCPDGTLGMERGFREHRIDRTRFRRRRRGPHLCRSERSRIGDVRRQQEGQHPQVAGAQRTPDLPGCDDAVGRVVRFQRRFRNIRQRSGRTRNLRVTAGGSSCYDRMGRVPVYGGGTRRRAGSYCGSGIRIGCDHTRCGLRRNS